MGRVSDTLFFPEDALIAIDGTSMTDTGKDKTIGALLRYGINLDETAALARIPKPGRPLFTAFRGRFELSRKSRDGKAFDSMSKCEVESLQDSESESEDERCSVAAKTPCEGSDPHADPGSNSTSNRKSMSNPPTLEDVMDNYREHKYYRHDPKKFFDHYEAVGWVTNSGRPIAEERTWKAQADVWEQTQDPRRAKNSAHVAGAKYAGSSAGAPRKVHGPTLTAFADYVRANCDVADETEMQRFYDEIEEVGWDFEWQLQARLHILGSRG